MSELEKQAAALNDKLFGTRLTQEFLDAVMPILERIQQEERVRLLPLIVAAVSAAYKVVHLTAFPADDPGGCDGCETGWCQSAVDAIVEGREQFKASLDASLSAILSGQPAPQPLERAKFPSHLPIEGIDEEPAPTQPTDSH